jgi:hypothetical protein
MPWKIGAITSSRVRLESLPFLAGGVFRDRSSYHISYTAGIIAYPTLLEACRIMKLLAPMSNPCCSRFNSSCALSPNVLSPDRSNPARSSLALHPDPGKKTGEPKAGLSPCRRTNAYSPPLALVSAAGWARKRWIAPTPSQARIIAATIRITATTQMITLAAMAWAVRSGAISLPMDSTTL